MNSDIMIVEDSHFENISSSLSRFHCSDDTTLISAPFILCLFRFNLLPDLLLHLDAIFSMSIPVPSLAPFVAVARLKQKIMKPQDLQKRTEVWNYLPAACTLLFASFVTSAWQNQQILSALSLTLSLTATEFSLTLSLPSALASAAALPFLASLPSLRIFLIFFFFPASRQFLRM